MTPKLYGLLAEFNDPAALLEAARQTRQTGYTKIDAYTPFPVEGLPEELDAKSTRIPWFVFGGGVIGAVVGYGMQYYLAAVAYPINVGGRPLNSWPLFIPVTFELTILFAALGAVIGMFALNGLPMPYHPVFNVERFASHATRYGFFLCIESEDPKFDYEATRQFLMSLSPREVYDVPA